MLIFSKSPFVNLYPNYLLIQILMLILKNKISWHTNCESLFLDWIRIIYLIHNFFLYY